MNHKCLDCLPLIAALLWLAAADAPIKTPAPPANLVPQWRPDLLGGVIVLRGEFADGTPFQAIPNFARNNRGGRSIVWVKE